MSNFSVMLIVGAALVVLLLNIFALALCRTASRADRQAREQSEEITRSLSSLYSRTNERIHRQ